MADVIRLDRHVLASPATAYDTAWATYGVSPGARSRSGRLEEEVPWGTHVTRAADPARLSGPVGEVLHPSNLDRLGQAVLPVGEWTGFALWGAFGLAVGSPERRVLTHTLLLRDDDFRRIRGYPRGLLRSGGRPAAWIRELTETSSFDEPVELSAVAVEIDAEAAAALDRARLDELHRLRGVALAAVEGDVGRLRGRLESLYEALARTAAEEDGPHHVVVRGVGAPTSCLLRLVWLSLPLEDRLRTAYVTEQRRTERPKARLLGLPEAEWGRYVPDGSWVLGEDEPFPVSAGRALWAERVAAPDFPVGFRAVDVRADVRRWSLVGGEELDAEARGARWRRRWRDEGPTAGGVAALWAVEARRPGGPRARGVGVALAGVVGAPDRPVEREPSVHEAAEWVAGLPDGARAPVLRGAVRTLRRAGTEGRIRGALLRCRVAAVDPEGAGELSRLVEPESDALRALLSEEGGSGGMELLLGAAPAAARGDAVARELLRVGTLEARWSDDEAGEIVRRLPDRGSTGAGGVVRDVLEALLGGGGPPEAVGVAARVLVPRLPPGEVAGLAAWLVTESYSLSPSGLGAAGIPVLRALAEGGGADAGKRAGALVEAVAGVRAPAADPDPWSDLVSEAPATWLGRTPVLEALVAAMGAGRGSFGQTGNTDLEELAGHLVGRLLERALPSGLGPERASAVLRLLWATGSDGSLDVLRQREDEAAVLADLLVRPAPVPLFHRIRARLMASLEGGGGRLAGPEVDEVARWAPGLAERAGPERRRVRVFLFREA